MDTATQYGQQNFNLPHDVVKLPSGGVFYKNKKKSLKIGYLTAADENLLMTQDASIRDNLVMTLLRNKIYESDVKPEDLLQGDIEAILIFLRNTAFGPEYKFRINDPDTGIAFESEIMLDELFIKKTEFSPGEDGYFSITLPKSGWSVKIKPLSFGEMNELDKMEQAYPQGRVAPKQTWKLNKMIVEIDGKTDKSMISQMIETIPISDSKYIKKMIEENEPRLDLTRRVIAPSGKETTVNIVFGVEFFRPFF